LPGIPSNDSRVRSPDSRVRSPDKDLQYRKSDSKVVTAEKLARRRSSKRARKGDSLPELPLDSEVDEEVGTPQGTPLRKKSVGWAEAGSRRRASMNEARMSLRERQVMRRVDNMEGEEVENLEGRYQTIVHEERQRQSLLREINQNDALSPSERKKAIKQRMQHDEERAEEIRQQRQEKHLEQVREREEVAAQREGDRDMMSRRLRRLLTLAMLGIAGKRLVDLAEEAHLTVARREVFATHQPLLWRALAATRHRAWCQRDIFMRGAVRRWRFHKKWKGANVIVSAIRSQRIRMHLRNYFLRLHKSQIWIKKMLIQRRALALVNMMWVTKLYPQWLKLRQPTTPDPPQEFIEAAVKRWLTVTQREQTREMENLAALRSQLAYDLHTGTKKTEDLAVAERMLLTNSYQIRQRKLLKKDDVMRMFDQIRARTERFICLLKDLEEEQGSGRAAIETRTGEDFQTLLSHFQSAKQQASPRVVIVPRYDALTGRRRSSASASPVHSPSRRGSKRRSVGSPRRSVGS